MLSSFLKDLATKKIEEQIGDFERISLQPGFFVSTNNTLKDEEVIIGEVESGGKKFFVIHDMD